mmetsp:Transcript_24692/g.53920  ORF Transcript_24692/g.53920 Transcript_24692/m.53920 type:complete len:206 (+) Transcript_24692:1548-2165(+)|eukprot:6183036-Pleurochrysis_carterae.AAC.5
MLLQLLCRLPRGSVDALQHRPLLVAAPVGARDRLKRDGRRVELSSVLNVRPRAQVPPAITHVVDGDWLLQSLEDFKLIRLVRLANATLSFLAGHLLTRQRQLHLDQLVHLLLDTPKILFLEHIGVVKIVVETLLDPRANGDLGVLEQALHRHGHNMSRGMADFQQLLVIVFIRWQTNGRRRRRCGLSNHFSWSSFCDGVRAASYR